jgi:hypothetical protein
MTFLNFLTNLNVPHVGKDKDMSHFSSIFEVIILCCFCYVIYCHVTLGIKARRLGCREPPKFPLSKSINLFFGFRSQQKRHTVVEGQAILHTEYGATFKRLTPMGNVIHTIHPANIRAVWKTDFDLWGVQHPRLKVLGEYCGRGIITVDGELWKKTHELTKPHFYGRDAPRLNLAVIDRYFAKYLGDLPNDKPVELKPLIYAMVSTSSIA